MWYFKVDQSSSKNWLRKFNLCVLLMVSNSHQFSLLTFWIWINYSVLKVFVETISPKHCWTILIQSEVFSPRFTILFLSWKQTCCLLILLKLRKTRLEPLYSRKRSISNNVKWKTYFISCLIQKTSVKKHFWNFLENLRISITNV